MDENLIILYENSPKLHQTCWYLFCQLYCGLECLLLSSNSWYVCNFAISLPFHFSIKPILILSQSTELFIKHFALILRISTFHRALKILYKVEIKKNNLKCCTKYKSAKCVLTKNAIMSPSSSTKILLLPLG